MSAPEPTDVCSKKRLESIEATFEQFDATIEKYPTLYKREQWLTDLGNLRTMFDDRVTGLERTHDILFGTSVIVDADRLDKLSKAYTATANFLKDFDNKQVVTLATE